MANYISKKLGKVNKFLTDITLDSSSVMTSQANKAWRAMIVLHRVTHGPTDHSDKKTDPAKINGRTLLKKAHRDIEVKEGKLIQTRSEGKNITLKFRGDTDNGMDVPMDTSFQDELFKRKKSKNNVIIYNLMSNAKYNYIILQNRPSSVEFKGETSWVSIKSMGRNTPMYHYTGAEDVLQFNVTWYANDPNYIDDVINKCRLLESWSKADGYKAAPPILYIQWGEPDPIQYSPIFDNQSYILTSATYTLKNFSDSVRQVESHKLIGVSNKGLYPMVATQELVFKRVSNKNLEYSDIINEEGIKHTRGIQVNE